MQIASTWVLSYAMHSIAICVLALVVLRFLRMDAATRCVIWRGALLLPLLTAPIAIVVSRAQTGGGELLSVVEPIRRHVPPRWAERKVDVILTTINGRTTRRVTEADDRLASAISFGIVLAAAVAAVAGSVGHRLRRSRIRRALYGCTPSAHYSSIAAARRIAITESDLIEVPIALGGREICLPRKSFFEMGERERSSVLLHEIAHVDRHDPEWMDASRVVAAITLWQPFNRMVCERLELDTEAAADQRAVALGAQPQALVAGLAYFAGLVDVGFAGAGAALLHKDSPLVARARLLLERQTQHRLLSPRAVVIGLTLIGAALSTLPVPTTAGSALATGRRVGAPPGTRLIQEERVITAKLP